MSERSYRDGIRDALTQKMREDESVILVGEDISLGGVFNVTHGLAAEFGRERVLDTPISEMGFMSTAFGAAVTGLRPVVEIMFGDFFGLVADTLGNQAAKYWYVSNEQAPVPLVVRTAVGAGASLGPLHSQTPTNIVLGMPGLKVVAPATPSDAYALTLGAIDDDNPVVVFEHKMLYQVREDIAQDSQTPPMGNAMVRRRGNDVTLVGAMSTVRTALEAADLLAAEGVSAEVVDLRSLRPLDVTCLAESAARTRRVVVIEDGPLIGSYGAEVLAAVLEATGPVAGSRVGPPDHAMPFSKPLETALLPRPDTVFTRTLSLME